MTDELVRAIERQIRHRMAKTDGESPYNAGNEWNADLWRQDTELVIGDYLEKHLNQWQRSPLRQHGGNNTTAGNSEGI